MIPSRQDKSKQKSTNRIFRALFTFFSSIYELEISVKNYNWLVKFTTEFSAELIEAESDIHRELSQFNERLQEILEIHLKRLLHETKEETDDVRLLVKICKEMKKLNLFEASYKITILYPKLEFLLQESISTSGSLFNFKLFIENLSKFIKELKSDWDHIIKEIYEEEGFKFWNRTILAPILTWIIERCSSVFIPTNLNEFKGNFEKGLSFISEIEEIFFAYEDELMTFRTQPAWINFMKKWALHQYYQISVKQILFPIESVMSHGLELAAEPKLFEPTLICINALKHLWSDEIIIKPLIPKYLKITLQVFRRFIDYCSEDVAFHRNPKVFLLTVIQKQFNLREFINLIEEELMESFEKHLDSLEEGLSQVILNKLKEESKGCFCRSESNNLISDVENLYDQLLLQREEIQSLSLEPLELLKRFEIANDLNQLIQRILLKFNRIIFKLIDEKRIKSSEFSEILKKMEELEGEVKNLGCAELVNEEFWLEIKAAINR